MTSAMGPKRLQQLKHESPLPVRRFVFGGSCCCSDIGTGGGSKCIERKRGGTRTKSYSSRTWTFDPDDIEDYLSNLGSFFVGAVKSTSTVLKGRNATKIEPVLVILWVKSLVFSRKIITKVLVSTGAAPQHQ